jgi:hypothetical protein
VMRGGPSWRERVRAGAMVARRARCPPTKRACQPVDRDRHGPPATGRGRPRTRSIGQAALAGRRGPSSGCRAAVQVRWRQREREHGRGGAFSFLLPRAHPATRNPHTHHTHLMNNTLTATAWSCDLVAGRAVAGLLGQQGARLGHWHFIFSVAGRMGGLRTPVLTESGPRGRRGAVCSWPGVGREAWVGSARLLLSPEKSTTRAPDDACRR